MHRLGHFQATNICFPYFLTGKTLTDRFETISIIKDDIAIAAALLERGTPVVALATTEMSTVIDNGRSGYIDTSLDKLVDGMHELLREPELARRMGQEARKRAQERFNIRRFVDDWNKVFAEVTQA